MAKVMKLKSIGILSAGKLQGIMGAVVGLILGVFFALINLVGGAIGGSLGMGAFGLASIIIFPLLYGIFGFIGGVAGAWIYNIFAKWIGGLEMELE